MIAVKTLPAVYVCTKPVMFVSYLDMCCVLLWEPSGDVLRRDTAQEDLHTP